MSEAQAEALVKLYVGYFNRAPEFDGLTFHKTAVLDQLNGNPAKTFDEALLERADHFFEAAIAQPEFSGYSANDTTQQFVETIYENVLLRPGVGADVTQDEVLYWVNKIDSGEVSRGELVLEFFAAQPILLANGTPEEKAITAKTIAILENRVSVGVEFAKPENSEGLLNGEAHDAGVAALKDVDDTPQSVDDAIATFTDSDLRGEDDTPTIDTSGGGGAPPANNAPTATASTSSGDEDATGIPVALGGSDGDGTIATVTVATLPLASQGELFLSDGTTPVVAGMPIAAAAAATLVFVPTTNFNGDVTIPFTVTDDDSATSASASEVITVNAVNDDPVAASVVLAAIAEDSGARVITAAELLAGVTDVDGPAATITALSVSSGNGTLVADAGGTAWTYTPALNDDTSVTFAYTASDGTLSASSTATLDITPVNDDPTGSGLPTNVTVLEGTTTDFDLSALNIGDVDGDALTVALTASAGTFAATSGSVTVGGSGTSALTLTGAASAINIFFGDATNIQYTGATGVSGDNAASAAINVNDSSVNPLLGTINIDITPNGPIVIDLSSLSAAQGFIIQGDDAGDRAGWSVSSAGDVNKDGIDDLIVGAPSGSILNNNSVGTAYVVFGSDSGHGSAVGGRQVIDLSSLSAAQGFVVRGEAIGDQAGYRVSSAGDVNKDGIDDLIVGATNSDAGGAASGAAYVVFGSDTGFGTTVGGQQVLDFGGMTAAQGFIIQGDAAGDQAGISVSSAGDVNKDGIDDLIVGAHAGADGGALAGEAYVVFGSDSGFGAAVGGRQVVDLSSLSATQGFIIQGDEGADFAGADVSSAGDVNKDGIDDLIVGAYAGDDGGANAGEAYVVFGSDSGFGTAVGGRQVIDLSSLSATQGIIFQGDDAGDLAGYRVSSAGDVNKDG
ncbi:MAG: cadherin-like domain-containing protein, partial [Hyphomicrobiaceae bacterium]